MASSQEVYNELSSYTLTHSDPSFIHQHLVDTFAAQTADEYTKPIKILFALIGLYLYLEKGYTGKQVQLAHMKIAKRKTEYPTFVLPKAKGSITAIDVWKSTPGEERDQLISEWCACVWKAYEGSHKQVADYLNKYYF